MIKNKLKELLSELKKFRIQTILVLEYKKRNDCKGARLFASDSDIDEAFKSMYQSFMTKMTNDVYEYCIVLDVIIEHSIKSFGC